MITLSLIFVCVLEAGLFVGLIIVQAKTMINRWFVKICNLLAAGTAIFNGVVGCNKYLDGDHLVNAGLSGFMAVIGIIFMICVFKISGHCIQPGEKGPDHA